MDKKNSTKFYYNASTMLECTAVTKMLKEMLA